MVSKGFWRRRNLLIGLAIVALSVGIVFASIPFLPASQVPHTTILAPKTITVVGGTTSRPGYGQLTVQLSIHQNFWVGVNVTSGTASFCALTDQAYQSWLSSYNANNYYPLTSNTCLLGPTQQEAQDTLKFVASSSGTWWIVALNVNSSPITVFFQPA
jgi:hypothetical protein